MPAEETLISQKNPYADEYARKMTEIHGDVPRPQDENPRRYLLEEELDDGGTPVYSTHDTLEDVDRWIADRPLPAKTKEVWDLKDKKSVFDPNRHP